MRLYYINKTYKPFSTIYNKISKQQKSSLRKFTKVYETFYFLLLKTFLCAAFYHTWLYTLGKVPSEDGLKYFSCQGKIFDPIQNKELSNVYASYDDVPAVPFHAHLRMLFDYGCYYYCMPAYVHVYVNCTHLFQPV